MDYLKVNGWDVSAVSLQNKYKCTPHLVLGLTKALIRWNLLHLNLPEEGHIDYICCKLGFFNVLQFQNVKPVQGKDSWG